MAESKFSLCPRGYGRTFYHVVETSLHMGLIPIHVYHKGDRPCLPYEDLTEIERMEEKIKTVRHYFTYEGVLGILVRRGTRH